MKRMEDEMRIRSMKLLLVAALLTIPVVAPAQKSRTAQEKTVVGYISDASCGLPLRRPFTVTFCPDLR